MSESVGEIVPEWDLADRMRKALRHADIGVQEMADYLGVARNTVGTWINGRIRPSRQTLRLWSLRCGVPLAWLMEGETGSGFRKSSSSTPLAAAA
jgi:transcriptional regulator with XRE-family HTH domain